MKSACPSPAVAYIYFDYGEKKTQSVLNLAINILNQLISKLRDGNVIQHPWNQWMSFFYTLRGELERSVSLSTVKEAIHGVAALFPVTYIIADAMDECDEPIILAKFMVFIRELTLGNVRVLIASRPTVPKPMDAVGVTVTADSEDLKKVISARISLSGKDAIVRMEQEITEQLLKAADGT